MRTGACHLPPAQAQSGGAAELAQQPRQPLLQPLNLLMGQGRGRARQLPPSTRSTAVAESRNRLQTSPVPSPSLTSNCRVERTFKLRPMRLPPSLPQRRRPWSVLHASHRIGSFWKARIIRCLSASWPTPRTREVNPAGVLRWLLRCDRGLSCCDGLHPVPSPCRRGTGFCPGLRPEYGVASWNGTRSFFWKAQRIPGAEITFHTAKSAPERARLILVEWEYTSATEKASCPPTRTF